MGASVLGVVPVTPAGAGSPRKLAAGAAVVALLCIGAVAVGSAEEAPAAPHARTAIVPAAASAPVPQADPYAAASADAAVELFLKLESGDSLEQLLTRAGTASSDARKAVALLANAGITLAPGSDITVALGDSAGSSSLAALALRPRLGLKVQIVRSPGGGLRLTSQSTNVDATPLRFRGRAGSGLFWSLRSAGVPADVATAYLDLVKSRVPLDRIAAGDRFDVVLEHRKAANGEKEYGALLFAGLDRTTGPDLQLVRWNAQSAQGWYDPRERTPKAEGMLRPVDGRLTSRFGYRVHPILRFGRFHSGVDYGARWGTPIRATADGVVTGAGWAGGYGRQVRLAHADGLATSYSHMSEIAAAPGTAVRRGDIIGYVGSTGLSTGAHLHYEVRRNGRLLDPLQVQQAGAAELSDGDRSALQVRLAQLLSI